MAFDFSKREAYLLQPGKSCVIQSKSRHYEKVYENIWSLGNAILPTSIKTTHIGISRTDDDSYGTFLGGFLLERLLAPMAMADGTTMTTAQVMMMPLMSMMTGVQMPPIAVPMTCPPQLTTAPCPSTPPQRRDVPAYISCDSQINIVEAIYGRQAGGSICPHYSIVTTSCRSPTSDALVKMDCNGESICQLMANNAKFGDPCQGTYKYLEVTYTCI
ncbi:unnamed protein product [Mytilus coruscus]|uniref:SUEL-type lectin domain-containing protein n=1 Tax=Mytilus coruscus TaxID=42192 RepID=A0A6J8DYQ6_MYTCO|nr:unnamed protein product [Mytilus coruscus]